VPTHTSLGSPRARRLTKNTKALLPVHWIGLPCELDRICEFAKEKGLIVLEDACQAHGASLQGKPVGSWGRMAAFSFQNTKPLPAIEGGMGVYQERADFERGSTLGHYDKPRNFPEDSPYRKYQGTGLGLKFRMHPMPATSPAATPCGRSPVLVHAPRSPPRVARCAIPMRASARSRARVHSSRPIARLPRR